MGRAPGRRLDEWCAAFDRLIAAGHSHSEILGYTLHQFRAYLRAAEARERRDAKERLLVAKWGALLASGDQRVSRLFAETMTALDQ